MICDFQCKEYRSLITDNMTVCRQNLCIGLNLSGITSFCNSLKVANEHCPPTLRSFPSAYFPFLRKESRLMISSRCPPGCMTLYECPAVSTSETVDPFSQSWKLTSSLLSYNQQYQAWRTHASSYKCSIRTKHYYSKFANTNRSWKINFFCRQNVERKINKMAAELTLLLASG